MPIKNGVKVERKNDEAPPEMELFVLDKQIAELNELYMKLVALPSPENAKKFLDRYSEVFMPVDESNP